MEQLVKFEKTAEIGEVIKVAKTLGIDYIAVRKPDLIAKVNSKIDSINEEGSAPTGDQPAVSDADNNEVTASADNSETSDNKDADNSASEAKTEDNNNQSEGTKKRGRKPNGTPKEPRVKKTKWYDEENADLPYAQGDIIEVHSGEILVGRKAQVVKMSAKKHAVKAILIHPVKGTLQGCIITLDYDKIQMAEDQTPPKGANEQATGELVKSASADKSASDVKDKQDMDQAV